MSFYQMKGMMQRHIVKVIFSLWLLAVWVLSTIPLHTPDVPNGDKIGHFISYGLLAFLAGALDQNRLRVWAWVSLMGVAVECVQYFLPWRSFELLDMLANSTGALLGVLLLVLAQRVMRAAGAKL